jgi:ribonuclease HI
VAGAGTHIVTRIFYDTAIQNGNNNEASSPPAQQQPIIRRTKTDIRKYLGNGTMTNNQAEYMGAIVGLEHVLETLQQAIASSTTNACPQQVSITVQGDSKLIIEQLKGNWECKSPSIQPLLRRAKGVIREIEMCLSTTSSLRSNGAGKLNIQFEHVYREHNAIADGLANAAMDAETSWTTTTIDDENEKTGGNDTTNDDDRGVGKKLGKIISI